MRLSIRRVYEPFTPADGQRVLVDRLWPRGISKEQLEGVVWLKDIAPSQQLRQWFNHESAKWADFCARYHAELDANPEAVKTLAALVQKGPVMLLYGAKDEQHNQAVALRDYLSTQIK